MNKSIALTLVYIFGILAFFLKLEIPFAILMFAILTVLLLMNYTKPLFTLLLAAVFIFANYNAGWHKKSPDELSKFGFKNDVTLVGRIISIPELSNNATRLRFYFDATGALINGKNHADLNSKTFISINDYGGFKDGAPKDLKIGNVIKIKGKLRKPSTATNPSQFDYAGYLANKNVFSTFYSDGIKIKFVSAPNFKTEPRWWIFQNLDLIRDRIILKHAKYIKSPNLEVLGGVVFGDDAVNPPDDIKQTFVNSGLLHLLAASGLNVALIFGIWWFFASKFLIPYKLNVFLGMLLVVFYSFMTGFPPSILRAMVMLLFVLFGKLIDEQTDALSLVFFACMVLLVFSPLMIFDVGFQLSFVVTAALIFCMPIIVDLFRAHNVKFKKEHKNKPAFVKKILHNFSPAIVVGVIFVPVVAQIAVAPIQAYYFNTFATYSILANLCVVPFIGLISFFGFISSIFGMFNLDFAMQVLDKCVEPFIVALLAVSNYFSNLKGSLLTFPTPTLLQILLYYAFAFFGFITLKNSFKNKKVNAVIALLVIAFSLTFIKIPSRNLEILAFDVGNADSFLITTPKNKHLLIDTGKLPYRGKSQASVIMNQYFKNKSVNTIDLLVLTHFDNDHCGGALDILKEFNVKHTLVVEGVPNSANEAKILDYLKDNNLKFSTLKSKNGVNDGVKGGEIVYFEPDLTLKAFVAGVKGKRETENENSIISLLTYKTSNVLFMGDAGALAFTRLKNELPLGIDILKVGHHGAKNSINNEMIKKLNPEIALISVGFNTYGHPSDDTLKIINDNNTAMLSTREFGALKFTYDDESEKFKAESFLKGKGIGKGKFSPIDE